jgi:putative transposase
MDGRNRMFTHPFSESSSKPHGKNGLARRDTFDPRDMGEVRVFYRDRFLCPAVSAELAGETIPLRDIIRVRNQRRRELSSVLKDRQKVVDALLELKRGTALKEIHANAAVLPASGIRIKRYRNE